jgi:hypothetical protein
MSIEKIENIFESVITLRLVDKLFELSYQDHRYQKLRKYNIILSGIMFTLAIILAGSLLFSLTLLWSAFNTQYSTMISFVTTLSLGINLLLSIFVKHNRVQDWVTYLNYTFVLFLFSSYRFYLIFVVKADLLVYTFVFTVEILLRLTFFFLGVIDFVPGVYLQVMSILLNYGIFAAVVPIYLHFRFSLYAGILIITTGITYFYIKEQKKSFFYFLSIKTKYDWFKNVIDNMNSGFISVRNREINYYNNTMVKMFTGNNAEIDSVALKGYQFKLDMLFENVESDIFTINSFNDAVQMLENNYSLIGDNFFFMGTKTVEISSTCVLSLEVYGRCYSSDHSIIDKYEFIFNDITRSKLIEEKNAEFKYKNLFLSKIAHEFKNPLLCICELVDQISEERTGV